MGFIGAGIFSGELFHDRLAFCDIVKINLTITKCQIRHSTVIEHFALACFRQDQKLMGVIATNRTTVRAHWNGLQAHAFIGAQIANQMAIVGVEGLLFGEVECVAIFHIELTAAHHPKTGAAFIAEFPLDLIHGQRHVFIAGDMATENIGDQFFSGRREQHIAVMTVFKPQHFLTVVIITPGFTPQICRLNRRHKHRQMACFFLFFMNDGFNFLENLETQRQPRINPSGGLFDHSRSQH